jgi:DNA-binding NarL/FixJ family response regulator
MDILDRTTRLLVAEDQTLLAEGLRRLLDTDFRSIEMTGSGSDLFDAVETFKPNVVLLSVGARMVHGIHTTRQLGRVSGAKIIMVTAHEESEYIAEAFRAGVSGYILQRCGYSELLKAVRTVMNGELYLTPLVPRQIADAVTESGPQLESRPLTFRQLEVLQLVAEGRTAKEIANSLNLSVKTAVFHKMAIREKLGLRTTAELTRYVLNRESGRTISIRVPVQEYRIEPTQPKESRWA